MKSTRTGSRTNTWRNGLVLGLALALSVVGIGIASTPSSSEKKEKAEANTMEKLTLGGGCFWCLEAVFEALPGVHAVVSGYSGGHTKNPTYKEVCNKDTGHAEVIQIEFDPKLTSVDALLDVFWQAHDPTTPNRQGADVGPQYRSIILFSDDTQKALAEGSIATANKQFNGKIVTELVKLETFYTAEAYHQDYFKNNPNQAYCQVVIRPKLNKLKKDGVLSSKP